MNRTALAGVAMMMVSVCLLAAAEQNGPALADIVKEVLATMDKMTSQLSTIKDEPSAEAARPELRKSAAVWSELHTKAQNAKPPSKDERDRLQKEYREKLMEANKKLLAEIARVKGVPGGRKALDEVKEISSAIKKSPK